MSKIRLLMDVDNNWRKIIQYAVTCLQLMDADKKTSNNYIVHYE